jgi:hypothetical protein
VSRRSTKIENVSCGDDAASVVFGFIGRSVQMRYGLLVWAWGRAGWRACCWDGVWATSAILVGGKTCGRRL